MGPDGYVYVSGLGAEVEGHVWKLHPRTGVVVDSWSGFLPLTGIAAGPDGSLYVSGIDFETFGGGIFRLAPGSRDVVGIAPVPAPLGLTFVKRSPLRLERNRLNLPSVDPCRNARLQEDPAWTLTV